MGSVPKPASLEIKGLDNEMAVARSTPDRLLVGVSVKWRDAEQIPTLLSILSDIPPAPNDHDFEVMRRDDGKYTLITNVMRLVRSGSAAGPSLYDLARRGGFVIGDDYLEYGSNIIKQYQPDFDYSASEEHALLLPAPLHHRLRHNLLRGIRRAWEAFADTAVSFLDEATFRVALASRVLTGRMPQETHKRPWVRSVETPALIDVRDWTTDSLIFSVLVWPLWNPGFPGMRPTRFSTIGSGRSLRPSP
jgi:hypothetical protein